MSFVIQNIISKPVQKGIEVWGTSIKALELNKTTKSLTCMIFVKFL
jgi:hypothetical protein